MFSKKLPLLILLFFNMMGSGFFYAQTNFIPNLCPQKRQEHSTFICQCAPLKIFADTAKPNQNQILPLKLKPEMVCPLGRHDFICQCGPISPNFLLLADTIKKKSPRKNKHRLKK